MFMSPYRMVERYLNRPSEHIQDQEGGGVADVQSAPPDMDEDAAPAHKWNLEDPHDTGKKNTTTLAEKKIPNYFLAGAPVGSDYVQIPLSSEYSDLINIFIKRTSFLRQKQFALDDHLFR
jgi:hypothetical protein